MYTYKAKVVRVLDGDTVILNIDLGFSIWMNDQPIRLNGIDTPETRSKDLNEKKAGLLAKKWVTEILPIGSTVTIQTVLDKDEKFGRTLGVIIKDGININEALIDNRYAVHYNGQSKEDIVLMHQSNISYLIETKQI